MLCIKVRLFILGTWYIEKFAIQELVISNFDIKKFVTIWFNIQPQNPLLYLTQGILPKQSCWQSSNCSMKVFMVCSWFKTWGLKHHELLCRIWNLEVWSMVIPYHWQIWIDVKSLAKPFEFFSRGFLLVVPVWPFVLHGDLPGQSAQSLNNGNFWFSYKLRGFSTQNPFSYNLLRRVNPGYIDHAIQPCGSGSKCV